MDRIQLFEQLGMTEQCDDRESFTAWVEQRHAAFTASGPLAFFPQASSCCTIDGPFGKLSLYVGLYDASLFEHLIDFYLFTSYSSSIQQEMYQRSSAADVDLTWFVPNDEDTRQLFVEKWWGDDPCEIFAGEAAQAMLQREVSRLPAAPKAIVDAPLEIAFRTSPPDEDGEAEWQGRSEDSMLHVLIMNDGFAFE